MYSTVPEFSVSVLLEVIKLVIMMCGIYNYKIKEDKKWILISLGSGVVLTSLCYVINNFWSSYNYGLNPVTMPITAIVMVMLMITGKKKLVLMILSELTITCIDEFVHATACKIFDASYRNSFYLITTSLSIIILTIPAIIIQNRKKNGMDYPIRKMSAFYLILLIMAQFVLFGYTSVLHTYVAGVNRNLILVCIIFITVTEFVMIYTIGRKDYYRNLSVMNEKMLEIQEKYYMKLLDHEDEIRKFRHDVNNHILSVEALLEEGKCEEARKYLSDIKRTYPLVKSVVRTGNTIVSAIASDYAERFPEVSLEWNGLFPDELAISNTDICTIFSNVLGNAFESADKAEKEKLVSASVKTVTNSMIITVKNTIGIPVIVKDGVLETTKDDKQNHGIGTRNIQKCVQANDGIVEYNFDESMFEIRIILPNVLKVF